MLCHTTEKCCFSFNIFAMETLPTTTCPSSIPISEHWYHRSLPQFSEFLSLNVKVQMFQLLTCRITEDNSVSRSNVHTMLLVWRVPWCFAAYSAFPPSASFSSYCSKQYLWMELLSICCVGHASCRWAFHHEIAHENYLASRPLPIRTADVPR